MKKLLALLVTSTVICSMGAELRTKNFIVVAANPQVCQSVAQWAEHYRKEKAIQWLGREMPPWPEPCPLHVTVAMDGPKGETEFSFSYGRVNSQRMKIHGPLERLIYSVLPHEITHTVFANHFKTPVPRWADEGGSVLSEDDIERERHDKLVRSILNRGQQIPLRNLLALKEYPQQVMCLYAQGFSLSDYLVKRSNKQHFLNFVGHGMQHGWDAAAKSYFGHGNVEELEQAWLQYLRDTKNKQQQNPVFASNTNTNQNNGTATFMGNQSGRTVRLTVPMAQPKELAPVARGAMPDQPTPRTGATQWEPAVRLEAPVPITSVPRIPPISVMQANWPK
ncbi:MAG TPA: hypothetical protein VFE62_15585 [Gemmataceae bacterium]|nr:hypothetical protein [Gemmataceae bacterium]